MATPKELIWDIEPHTIAKHKILESYLRAWFPILGRSGMGLNYIDGFAGPGKYSKDEKGSPIIALDVAKNHTSQLEGTLSFIFIEKDEGRYKHLTELLKLEKYPSNFEIETVNGEFSDIISGELDKLEKESKSLAPTFAFIDPFGFSGIPFSLVRRLLANKQVEVFINFSVDSINRFIGTKESGSHIEEMFGDKEAIQIIDQSSNREKDLRDLYQKRLNEQAKFVRYFRMCDKDDRPIYYLFFASNNPLGQRKMKEAMWKVDSEGDYKFSDATDEDQIVLFRKDNFDILLQEIMKKFSLQKIEVSDVRKYVREETPFIDKHLTGALKLGEESSIITVETMKKDGSKRKKGTFPDGTIIIFGKQKLWHSNHQ